MTVYFTPGLSFSRTHFVPWNQTSCREPVPSLKSTVSRSRRGPVLAVCMLLTVPCSTTYWFSSCSDAMVLCCERSMWRKG